MSVKCIDHYIVENVYRDLDRMKPGVAPKVAITKLDPIFSDSRHKSNILALSRCVNKI